MGGLVAAAFASCCTCCSRCPARVTDATLAGMLAASLGGGIEVFGDPSEALREAAAQMQPAIYSYFQGK